MTKKRIFRINNSGTSILDNIPENVQPGWAGFMLSLFNVYVEEIPPPINELVEITNTPKHWRYAHEYIYKIRKFILENPGFQPRLYLLLAENIAKLTYNASKNSAAIDKGCEWDIPFLAIRTANYFKDVELEGNIESILLLFNRIPYLKKIIKTSNDFFLFKQIDDILWISWYSLSEEEINFDNKYQGYIPDIFILKKMGADIKSMTNRIYQIEKDILNLSGNREYCSLLAEAILAIK